MLFPVLSGLCSTYLALTFMPQGICRLCQVNAELQLSHIIPAFVYRWLRESSGSGYLRSSKTPNRRVQDGPQEYWLCANCEALFNRSETAFANQLFHPYLAASGQRFRYGEWLLKFCTSLSWRVLQYHLSSKNHEAFESWALEAIKQAEAAWRAYLLGQTQHPGSYRQHIVPFDQVGSFTGNLPSNINRYLMRAIQIDFCQGGKTLFVYSKIGRFAILGFIAQPEPSHWAGSRVNANAGTLEPRTYTFPHSFRAYLTEQAGTVNDAMASMSSRQRQRVDETLLANLDRIRGSDFFTAMQADVDLFGQNAFTPHSQDLE